MSAARTLRRLARDDAGSMIIEFAILGPALIVMLLGVLQTGIAMQNYNALRNISADVARYAMVQRQGGNILSNAQLRTYAVSTAQSLPYMLDRTKVNATVATATTQRIAGANELTITVTYQIESLLEFAGIEGPFISHTRPIFLITS